MGPTGSQVIQGIVHEIPNLILLVDSSSLYPPESRLIKVEKSEMGVIGEVIPVTLKLIEAVENPPVTSIVFKATTLQVPTKLTKELQVKVLMVKLLASVSLKVVGITPD